MLKTCEDYAGAHNLRFSTDPNPTKCKTKCLKFLKKDRFVEPLMLCGNPLPWVQNCKHLGNHLENKIDGMKKDVKIKRACYIDKNNELLQEFHHCHPKTIFDVNRIYNSSFSGSPLWKLSSREVEMLENTWNRSIRLMFDVPNQTHRYFIVPISDHCHLRSILVKRFLNFIDSIKKSSKDIISNLFQCICFDVRSTTGSNLREIMLSVNKDNVLDLEPNDSRKVKYNEAKEEDKWRIDIVKELIEVKNGTLQVENITFEEATDILETLCID